MIYIYNWVSQRILCVKQSFFFSALLLYLLDLSLSICLKSCHLMFASQIQIVQINLYSLQPKWS